MSELSSEQVLGRLADQIHNPTPDTNELPIVYLRFGTVVSTGSNRAVISFAGQSNIPNCRYLSAIAPSVGYVVAVLQYRVPDEETAYLVLGNMA